MTFKGWGRAKVMRREFGKARQRLRETPRNDRAAGVNRPGADEDNRRCKPDRPEELELPCDRAWHELTFGAAYIRSQRRQLQGKFGPEQPLIYKGKTADKYEIGTTPPGWINDGTGTAQNAQRIIGQMQISDRDLYYRINAWAGRPAPKSMASPFPV